MFTICDLRAIATVSDFVVCNPGHRLREKETNDVIYYDVIYYVIYRGSSVFMCQYTNVTRIIRLLYDDYNSHRKLRFYKILMNGYRCIQ